MKKLAAILLAGMVVLGMAAFPASAEEETPTEPKTYEDGMFTFAYVDGGVSLYSCDPSALAVIIPDTTDGRKIVAIGEGAFNNCTKLESIQIGRNVTEIGDYAFYECTALKSVTIPDNVKSIGDYCFFDCVQLRSAKISDTLTEIPEGAFYNCCGLQECNMPESLESIGIGAFYNCTLLPDLEFPETLTEIADYAFGFCYALENITLPSSVTHLNTACYYGCINLKDFCVPVTLEDIGSLTFMGCVSLTEFRVEEGNNWYTAEDGILYSKDKKTLCAYPAGRQDAQFSVPEGVENIHDGAFFTAKNLEDIVFPNSLKHIGAGAFEYCESLYQVVIPDGTETIAENAFADCTELKSVQLPDSLTEIGDYAFYSCTKLKEAEVPAGCKTGDYAFGYQDSETETNAEGNPAPVKIDGFKMNNPLPVKKIILCTCVGAVFLLAVVLLIRVIRKTQMTKEEKEVLDAERNAELEEKMAEEDAQYVKILESVSGEPPQVSCGEPPQVS